MNLTISTPLSTLLNNINKQIDNEALALALLVCGQLARDLESKLGDVEVHNEELNKLVSKRLADMQWKYFSVEKSFSCPTVVLLENDMQEQFVGAFSVSKEYTVVSLRSGSVSTYSPKQLPEHFSRYMVLLK